MNASRVVITDANFSYQALGALTGISGFIGNFERGPINDPSILITSAMQLRKLYGGYVSGNDDLLMAERILNRGGKLRIVNIKHYDDPSDPDTLDATKAGNVNITLTGGGGGTLVALAPRYAGAKYNSMRAVVSDPSNGQAAAGYFNLTIFIVGDEFYTTETYTNLIGPSDRPGAGDQSWLSIVEANSLLVKPVYQNLSTIAPGPMVPTKSTLSFTGGSDGDPVVPADYIGNQAGGTGLYSLDGYGDMYDFAAPSVTQAAFHNAAASYAQSRGDIEYVGNLGHTLTTAAGLISARDAVTVNSKYYSLSGGGIKILDPLTGAEKIIPQTADILGIGAYVDTNFRPWYSQDNFVKGFIPNAIGVNYNLGSPGAYPTLNQLANRQINMVVADKGLIYLKGNFSGEFATSKASFRNVVRLLIYIKKTLRPMLERYLGEPNDFTTFRLIYNEVKPFLTSLYDNRATYTVPVWQGDQDATTMADLKINLPADLDAGKYRVLLSINPIPGLNELLLEIGINSSGIEFTDPNL